MPKYTAGWITVPGKGKRWRTEDGEFLMQRPAGGGLQGVMNVLGGAWRQADRAVGGWLPGGGTASPVTRAVFPPQPFPGRSKELEIQSGVRARFVDPGATPTLVSRVAPELSPRWGDSNYANPLLGEVGMQGYRGGATPVERRTEFHELGHINPKDKELYSYLGVAGRTLQGVSNRLGGVPLLDIASGAALKNFDAKEEDRAERFAARYSRQGAYAPPVIGREGTSNYGNNLRREGDEMIERGVKGLTNPFGAVDFFNGVTAKPLADEYKQTLNRMRPLVQQSDGTNPPQELVELSRRSRELEDLLRSKGVDPFTLQQ